jgi:large subunit ribosomal protein L9
MKVILQQDIPKVGKGGDIVTVADGYARNFLLPRKYAVSATGGALKEHQARAAREKERTAGQLQGAQASASKLEGKSVTILTKVGTGTKLYGSVTSQDVADAVEKETGVKVDKRRVALVDPIKTLGEYTIAVRLHADVTVNLKVIVTTEEEIARKKAAEAAAAAKAEAEAKSGVAPVAEAPSEPETAVAEDEEAEAEEDDEDAEEDEDEAEDDVDAEDESEETPAE